MASFATLVDGGGVCAAAASWSSSLPFCPWPRLARPIHCGWVACMTARISTTPSRPWSLRQRSSHALGFCSALPW